MIRCRRRLSARIQAKKIRCYFIILCLGKPIQCLWYNLAESIKRCILTAIFKSSSETFCYIMRFHDNFGSRRSAFASSRFMYSQNSSLVISWFASFQEAATPWSAPHCSLWREECPKRKLCVPKVVSLRKPPGFHEIQMNSKGDQRVIFSCHFNWRRNSLPCRHFQTCFNTESGPT